MSIYYALIENRLTAEPGDYFAQVNPISTAGVEDVINKMVDRGSTVTSADIRSVLDDLAGTIENLLADGINVTLPFANYSISIKGTFYGSDASFDPSVHVVKCNILPGKDLSAAIKDIHPVKTQTVKPLPTLMSFTDLNSGEIDSIATPGGMGQIMGSKLQFNASNAEEGIFLIAADNTATKVDVVGMNKSTLLMFLIPGTLTTGTYTLEVRSSFGNELRTGKLSVPISVA